MSFGLKESPYMLKKVFGLYLVIIMCYLNGWLYSLFLRKSSKVYVIYMVFLPLSQYIFNYDIAKQAICIHYSFQYLHGKSKSNHYLYLLGSYTRLSCTLIKYILELATITNNRIHILYFPSPPAGWTNLLISDVHVGKINWRSLNPVIIFPCIL